MPWKKGQSGNPLGKPCYNDTYEGCLRRLSAQDLAGKGLTMREAVCRQAMKLAMKGVPWAVQYVTERLEGKAAVKVDLQARRSPLSDLSDSELQAALEFIKSRKANFQIPESASIQLPAPEPKADNSGNTNKAE